MEREVIEKVRSAGVSSILRSELSWLVRYGSGLVLLMVAVGICAAAFVRMPFVADAVCESVDGSSFSLLVDNRDAAAFGSGGSEELMTAEGRKYRCEISSATMVDSGKLRLIATADGFSPVAGSQLRVIAKQPLYRKWFPNR